ncbi:MAG TPA: shikimate dehydrogenase [Candidatus Eisenbacteria bacterium]|jgi:shikimate dehydrogenase|nr:shikimate dehydrogenase [Candidatus Eisenbacteria bacterium]
MDRGSFQIDAETRLYGIFGDPVRHSLSPVLHNALFRARGLNAVYLAFTVEKAALGLAFEALRSLGMRGVNLTIPLKEEALNHIDEIPEDIDRAVGALNTVVNRDGVLYGYNTDVPGFLAALRDELGFNPAGRSVLVIGAGGAARGAAFALAHAGAARVCLTNRTEGRAEGLAEHLAGHFPETEFEAVRAGALTGESFDLAVNATACGMKPGDPSPFDLSTLNKAGAAYDLIYKPAVTPFLESARRLKIPTANGLGMLASQAALSFALWTGQAEGVREAMMETLKQWGS